MAVVRGKVEGQINSNGCFPGGLVSNIFFFSTLFGEDFQFDEHIFQRG